MSRAAQGLRAWLLQRFTAIYLGLYLLAVLAYLGYRGPLAYEQWRALLAQPLMAVSTTLFALAVLLHAWVGIRDVLIDYVHAVWLRLSLMAVFGLVLMGSLLWVLRSLSLAAGGATG
jgi:succinate dehydrogenase / fumarate reductase membrane anchor subunit